MKIRNFRERDVWKLGKEIMPDVSRVIKDFPREELYGLVSQMRRAVVSIPCECGGAVPFHKQSNAGREIWLTLRIANRSWRVHNARQIRSQQPAAHIVNSWP